MCVFIAFRHSKPLENDKTNALEELDLKYAMELDERIADLKKERDKTVKEYETYNNQVRKQNADYQVKRQSDIEKYLESRRRFPCACAARRTAR